MVGDLIVIGHLVDFLNVELVFFPLHAPSAVHNKLIVFALSSLTNYYFTACSQSLLL